MVPRPVFDKMMVDYEHKIATLQFFNKFLVDFIGRHQLQVPMQLPQQQLFMSPLGNCCPPLQPCAQPKDDLLGNLLAVANQPHRR